MPPAARAAGRAITGGFGRRARASEARPAAPPDRNPRQAPRSRPGGGRRDRRATRPPARCRARWRGRREGRSQLPLDEAVDGARGRDPLDQGAQIGGKRRACIELQQTPDEIPGLRLEQRTRPGPARAELRLAHGRAHRWSASAASPARSSGASCGGKRPIGVRSSRCSLAPSILLCAARSVRRRSGTWSANSDGTAPGTASRARTSRPPLMSLVAGGTRAAGWLAARRSTGVEACGRQSERVRFAAHLARGAGPHMPAEGGALDPLGGGRPESVRAVPTARDRAGPRRARAPAVHALRTPPRPRRAERARPRTAVPAPSAARRPRPRRS